LYAFFKDNLQCQAFAAPFDVRLYNAHLSALRHEEITTVVQPDLCVICDSQKLDELGCNGAPDWVIEILSEGNSKKEMRIKYELYEAAGVREYWVVDPEHETVHQFVLDEATHKFRVQQIYTSDETATSAIFRDLSIPLNDLFATQQPT
jgi:Uma2 family endonuclease